MKHADKKRSVYKTESAQQLKWIDVDNKIFHEINERSVYVFGIRIIHRRFDCTQEVDKDESSKKGIGFSK